MSDSDVAVPFSKRSAISLIPWEMAHAKKNRVCAAWHAAPLRTWASQEEESILASNIF